MRSCVLKREFSLKGPGPCFKKRECAMRKQVFRSRHVVPNVFLYGWFSLPACAWHDAACGYPARYEAPNSVNIHKVFGSQLLFNDLRQDVFLQSVRWWQRGLTTSVTTVNDTRQPAFATATRATNLICNSR